MVASEDEELDLSKVPVEDLKGSQVEYVGIRVGAARIGSSASETNWSTRGWMQEKRLSSRSIKLVNSLVRLHSNIIAEPLFDAPGTYATVPWDVECCIPEFISEDRGPDAIDDGLVPEPDDEIPDGPRRVFTDDTEELDDDDIFGDPDKDLALADSDSEEDLDLDEPQTTVD